MVGHCWCREMDVHPADSFKAAVSITMSTNVLRQAGYVAIVGSRTYPDLERVKKVVELLDPNATVVSGGADGVDDMADAWACETFRQTAIVRPSKRPQASSSFIAGLFGRNTVIVRGSDVVVAFWDGKSTGTRDTIEKALTVHGFCIVALPGEPPEVWERYRK